MENKTKTSNGSSPTLSSAPPTKHHKFLPLAIVLTLLAFATLAYAGYTNYFNLPEVDDNTGDISLSPEEIKSRALMQKCNPENPNEFIVLTPDPETTNWPISGYANEQKFSFKYPSEWEETEVILPGDRASYYYIPIDELALGDHSYRFSATGNWENNLDDIRERANQINLANNFVIKRECYLVANHKVIVQSTLYEKNNESSNNFLRTTLFIDGALVEQTDNSGIDTVIRLGTYEVGNLEFVGTRGREVSAGSDSYYDEIIKLLSTFEFEN